MSLPDFGGDNRCDDFPRVSGDEPADEIARIARKTFSPRERG